VGEADLLLTVGTRLSDFSTGSRTALSNVRVPQINLNVAQFDANKHGATALRCDARRALEELQPLLQGWTSDSSWGARTAELKAVWAATVAAAIASSDGVPSDAQVTGLIIEAQSWIPQRVRLLVHGLRVGWWSGREDGAPRRRGIRSGR